VKTNVARYLKCGNMLVRPFFMQLVSFIASEINVSVVSYEMMICINCSLCW
jgi:hypothetical protein